VGGVDAVSRKGSIRILGGVEGMFGEGRGFDEGFVRAVP
jgi:hypothetical protein